MVGGGVGQGAYLSTKVISFFSTHAHAHALTHTPMSRCHS